MSHSSVDRRRRRSIDSVNEGDEDSFEGDLYASTPKNKRQRVHEPEEDDGEAHEYEVSEDGAAAEDDTGSPEGSLLPDSFRRSPKGKAPARDISKHQPGAIVRVKLKNFVTYSNAEFYPGPNLNMVIGPNGTGKSTLVCAICLGLGWSPENLGRAKSIGEFVKKGTKQADIEIELAADPERHDANLVIKTRIFLDKGKAEFRIGDNKATAKALKELMQSFSIQVDNLCQFLPQDRVVEFAGLSSVKLLTETLQAAAPPEMNQWHTELKNLRKQQKEQAAEEQDNVEQLAKLEKRHADSQAQTDRIMERRECQAKVVALEKLKPFPAYREAAKRFYEAKTRFKDASKDLKRLQKEAEPNLKREQEKGAYLERIRVVVDKRGTLVKRSEEEAVKQKAKISTQDDKMKGNEHALGLEKKVAHSARQNMPKLLADKAKVQRAMQTPPEEADFGAYNEQVRDKLREIREVEDRQAEMQAERQSIGQHVQQREQIINRAENEKASLQTQAGQQANKLRMASRDAHQAWEWIQRNQNKFREEIYGPPIVTCVVKDPRNAAAVESALGQGEMAAFTATNREDYKTLSDALYGHLRLDSINLRQSSQPLAAFHAPATPERLHSLGLDGYILDLIDGPEPVLAMLCDNRNIHGTAFTSRELSSAQMDALKARDSPVSSWVTPTETYRINRRREYGEKATSTQATALKKAKYFTELPASANEDAELEERISEAQRAIDEFKAQKARLNEEYSGLGNRRKKLETDKKEIEDEKNRKQRALATFSGLPVMLQKCQRLIDEAQAKIEGSEAKRRELTAIGDQIATEKGQCAINYANAVNALRDLIVQHMDAQILHFEAQSDLEKLKERTVEERRLLKEREAEVIVLQDTKTRLKAEGDRWAAECRELEPAFEHDKVLADLYEKCEEEVWDAVHLATEIESTSAKLDMLDGNGGQRELDAHEERAKKIEGLRRKRDALEADLKEVEDKIAGIRAQWEPRLDELVAEISAAFSDNFGKIQCAGEVTVHKDEDFEQWAIQIWVKFRENAPLTLLTSKYQSGGERAVSTIFYLMALQRLTRAPFRVVDEINQGMDPRNERMVHSRMVDIACGEGSASQYFLITPKLLPGLEYREGMKVHCIASGEHMPNDYKKLDFGMLAKKALALRG
ncbi:Structural maintenance of chromosomes protein 5 [Elasticomyces elasticus]|nr:Structural maintenance of chromosomes protein 5 [Elasticomyces elasticus]